MGAVGQVEKFEFGSVNIVVPDDMVLNFWSGGKVVTDALHNNGSATPKVAFRAGCITGITARAAKKGEIKKLVDLLQNAVLAPKDCIVVLANGEEWSAPVFGQWDDGSFFNSEDGKLSFAVYAKEGKFNQVG
jgi:hypothetical protein